MLLYTQSWYVTYYQLACLMWSFPNWCYLKILWTFQFYFNYVLQQSNYTFVYIYQIQLHWSVKLLKMLSLKFYQLNKVPHVLTLRRFFVFIAFWKNIPTFLIANDGGETTLSHLKGSSMMGFRVVETKARLSLWSRWDQMAIFSLRNMDLFILIYHDPC